MEWSLDAVFLLKKLKTVVCSAYTQSPTLSLASLFVINHHLHVITDLKGTII